METEHRFFLVRQGRRPSQHFAKALSLSVCVQERFRISASPCNNLGESMKFDALEGALVGTRKSIGRSNSRQGPTLRSKASTYLSACFFFTLVTQPKQSGEFLDSAFEICKSCKGRQDIGGLHGCVSKLYRNFYVETCNSRCVCPDCTLTSVFE